MNQKQMTIQKKKIPQIYHKSLIKRILLNWEFYVFVLPLVVYLIVFRYMPMYGVQIAFKDFKLALGIEGSSWVGFRYFQQFFNSFYFKAIPHNSSAVLAMTFAPSKACKFFN